MNCPSCQSENIEGARFCAKCGALLPTTEEPEKDALLGQTLGGRYVIKKILGEGGMGRVYEAERALAGIQQRVAIKTLHPHLSKDPQVVARFHRECRTIAQLRHPNTIKVEDFGQSADGTLYIAMEFVEGNSVEKELEQSGPMPPDRVERIMSQVCGSLAEAHKQGVIHRDLKPDNVVLMNVGDEQDFVKVLDFGIAARKDSTDAQKEAKLTQQGMVLGTPPYMSPEQFMGKELDPRSDIYSLAVMSYEMLTGRLPFEANTPWEWATKHMTAQPFPFEDTPTVTDIPGKMKHAIMKALSKNPQDRHATVREFFEDLSIGGARMGSLTTHGTSVGDAPKETSAMAPFDGGQKGQTQAAAPMSLGSGFGDAAPGSVSAGQSATPGGVAIPPAVPVAPTGASAGGPNKGLLYGIAGVVGIVVIGLIVVVLKRSSSTDGTSDINVGGPSSNGGVATVTPIPNSTDTVPIDTSKGHTTGTPATATTTKPPALSGDAACAEATRLSQSGNVSGAIAAYRGCSGPGQANARSQIAGAVPRAVQNAAYRNDCRTARAIAAEGGVVGAGAINVDQQYPQCRGK